MSLKNLIFNCIQQKVPVNLGIVKGSVPICFFGNIEKAKIATVGINPSSLEFLNKDGTAAKRVITRKNMQVPDSRELSSQQVQQVYDDCIKYFKNNPFESWFGTKSKGFNAFLCNKTIDNCSYYNDTMVHIDITPWATSEAWNNVPVSTQKQLIQEYKDILENIINTKNFRAIYINGVAVKKALEQALNIKIPETLCRGYKTKTVVYNYKYKNCLFIGTNRYYKYASIICEKIIPTF